MRARPVPGPGRAPPASAVTRRSSLRRENARSSRPRSTRVMPGNRSRRTSSRPPAPSTATPASREDLPAERVERPHPDAPGRDTEWRQRAIEAVDQLLGRPLVERHDAHGPRIRAAVHQPGDPRDQRRRLAGSRRRHAQHRARRRRGGRALVGGEPREARGDGRVGRGCHCPRSVAPPTHPPTCRCVGAPALRPARFGVPMGVKSGGRSAVPAGWPRG